MKKKHYVEQWVQQLGSSSAIFFFGFYIAVMFIFSDVLPVRIFGGKALCCWSWKHTSHTYISNTNTVINMRKQRVFFIYTSQQSTLSPNIRTSKIDPNRGRIKIQWKISIAIISTCLFTKSQGDNTLIRELLCVFPYKFCLLQRVICIKRLNNFTSPRRENELKSLCRNSLHILECVAVSYQNKIVFCRFSFC